MKTALTVLAVLVILFLAGIAFVHSGIYDVAASTPDSGFVGSMLRRASHSSIERRSEGIQVPRLDDPDMIKRGLIHYYEMCVVCHSAPGVKPSEIAQGLNPYPPELAEKAEPDEAGEWFWIVKHGIKMTGMPAFGVTHDDQEIWAIIAFLQKMPHLSPEEYQKMVQEVGLEEPIPATAAGETGEADEHGHSHEHEH
ncbi:MAG TPA: cytochrome c [Thermoanaerobaculia bacterium]|jgi:mono/diheme cytochrome c family protein|nr:cytochrome c [Thermoanaerobaculia bacterium]